ncbi:hypothetical protein BDR26DRAFT_872780 [Obelidium mucronatum]|nr:hypothetical protein BDR26DRAFT_872780 [Obelidium mucronatum]
MLESGKPTNWTCTSVDAYADKMALLYTNYPDRLAELLHAKYLIKVSTILEAASTGVDMLFGFSTIWAIMYPNANSRAQLHSIYFCVFGVLLAPALCIVDMVFQFHYWEVLGIGAFNYNSQSGFWFSGDVTIVATAVDVIVSLWFMDWGVKREARLRKEQQEAESKGESEAATIEGATNGHEMVRKV